MNIELKLIIIIILILAIYCISQKNDFIEGFPRQRRTRGRSRSRSRGRGGSPFVRRSIFRNPFARLNLGTRRADPKVLQEEAAATSYRPTTQMGQALDTIASVIKADLPTPSLPPADISPLQGESVTSTARSSGVSEQALYNLYSAREDEMLRRIICSNPVTKEIYQSRLCPPTRITQVSESCPSPPCWEYGGNCIGECDPSEETCITTESITATQVPANIQNQIRSSITATQVPTDIQNQIRSSITATQVPANIQNQIKTGLLQKCPNNRPYRPNGSGTCTTLPKASCPKRRKPPISTRRTPTCRYQNKRVCTRYRTTYRSTRGGVYTRYCNMRRRYRKRVGGRWRVVLGYPYREKGTRGFAYCKAIRSCSRYQNRRTRVCSSKVSRRRSRVSWRWKWTSRFGRGRSARHNKVCANSKLRDHPRYGATIRKRYQCIRKRVRR